MTAGTGMRYWWPWHPFLAAFLLMMLAPFVLAYWTVKVAVVIAVALFHRWQRWRRQRAAQRALQGV